MCLGKGLCRLPEGSPLSAAGTGRPERPAGGGLPSVVPVLQPVGTKDHG